MSATLPEIARRLGGRDHTTILNLVRRASEFWGLPDPFAAGSAGIARRYIEWGTWDGEEISNDAAA